MKELPLRELLWLPLVLLQGLGVVFWTCLWIPIALVVRALAGQTPALAMARSLWAPGILACCGIRVEVKGLENLEISRPYLFAVNHQSQLDIPVAFRVLPAPLRFMVKEELRRVPVLSWYIRAMGMIFVDRRDRLRSVKRMWRAREVLARGGYFLSFPEGQRSRDGRLQRFKTGAMLPAIQAGVEVVPVAIEGAAQALPAGTTRLRPGTVRVAVGQPVPTAGLQEEDRRALAQEVEDAVRRLYDALAAERRAQRER
jgi:1-acyl-sn-glycerol-3-phosphate acyltransferase